MRGRPNCVWPMILWPLICDRMASNTLMLYKYMTNPSTHSLPPLTSRTQRTPFWESRSHECFLLTHPVMNLPLSSPSLTPHAPLPPLPSLPLSGRRWRGRSTRCMRGEAGRHLIPCGRVRPPPAALSVCARRGGAPSRAGLLQQRRSDPPPAHDPPSDLVERELW